MGREATGDHNVVVAAALAPGMLHRAQGVMS